MIINKIKSKINYYYDHVFFRIVENIKGCFTMWSHLMTNNFDNYEFGDNDPQEECASWFWYDLNGPDILPQEFIEELEQMAKDVNEGKIQTYSLDEIRESLEDHALNILADEAIKNSNESPVMVDLDDL